MFENDIERFHEPLIICQNIGPVVKSKMDNTHVPYSKLTIMAIGGWSMRPIITSFITLDLITPWSMSTKALVVTDVSALSSSRL